MSDVEDDLALDELLCRQKMEKKEQKDKILVMKKTAKSGNKKQQKCINEEMEKMEKELTIRHEREIAELRLNQLSLQDTLSIPSETKMIAQTGTKSEAESFYKEAGKKTKAMKRREKKDDEARRAHAAVKEDKVNSKFSQRNIEWEAINGVLSQKGLSVVEIAADGDCLFNAVADQLTQSGSNYCGRDMRIRAANYMRAHIDDFLPFITACDVDGQEVDNIGFDLYCNKVESDSNAWGGEVEIIALSKSLKKKIEIIQPDGRVLTFGDEFHTKPLVLTYHRHAYLLGEHYNSTIVSD